MAKTSKKPKNPAKSAKRKITVKDLKAKNAGSVKGGTVVRKIGSVAGGESRDEDHKNWY
jgi:uncharacterized Zn ribbon protein